MTGLKLNISKEGIKKLFVAVIAVCICMAVIKFGGFRVTASVLNGILPSNGCVTDGNAEAKKALTTTGNGEYFHTYKNPTYTWSDDNTKCTANLVCNYGDDTLSAECIVSSKTKPASTTANGKITKTAKVTVYNKTYTTTKNITIKKASSILLSDTVYTYNGKSRTPAVTVKDSAGKQIPATNYTVSYNDNKAVGTATVTVNFIGDEYTGSLTKTFKIVPAKTSLKSVKATKNGFKATWTKKTTQTTGYQLRYSTSSSFAAGKTKTVTLSKNSTVSKEVKGLSSGKTYYVQIRTYKTVDGKKFYSDWSDSVTIKTK